MVVPDQTDLGPGRGELWGASFYLRDPRVVHSCALDGSASWGRRGHIFGGAGPSENIQRLRISHRASGGHPQRRIRFDRLVRTRPFDAHSGRAISDKNARIFTVL